MFETKLIHTNQQKRDEYSELLRLKKQAIQEYIDNKAVSNATLEAIKAAKDKVTVLKYRTINKYGVKIEMWGPTYYKVNSILHLQFAKRLRSIGGNDRDDET